ncbi:MAG: enoyl-CoA hydratase/isomerase family protein [Planctomycetes bacterium]|nr:enoyl-CoA hydratase/isomerase family protein [Planctomycetota bacterium]
MTTVRVEVAEGIALVTLDRPEVRNAISAEVVSELHAALDDLGSREDLRAVILTGAGGKAFAAGADIAELVLRRRDDAFRAINAGLFRRVESFPRPTIAAVRGWALGAGCELALACDLRVCGESARFGQPEVGLGIIPGAGGCYRLPRLVGVGIAKELIYTGRIIDAAEALRIGLVNRVVADGELEETARALAAEIARNDPLAVRLAKSVMDAAFTGAEPYGLELAAQASCFESPAKEERMRSFLARRKKDDR